MSADRKDLIAAAAHHYVGWLASGPPLEAVDATLENLMHLLEVVEDPALRADLAIALIGDDLDDPNGYIPSRGLARMLLDESVQHLLEETIMHKVLASRAGPIFKNLGLFMHRANDAGAEYVLRKAKEVYDQLEDENGSASTSWILGAVAEDSGSYRDAVTLFRAPRLNSSNPTIRALSHHLEGCAHYHWGNFDSAHDSFKLAGKEAKGLSSAIGLRIDRGLAYVELANGGDKKEVKEHLVELRKRAEELGRPREAARCTRHIGHAQRDLGDLKGARQNLEQARDEFRRLGDQRGLGATLCALAGVLRESDDIFAARTAALSSLEIARGKDGVLVPMNSLIGVARAEEELAEIERIAHEDEQEVFDGHLRRACNIFETIHHPRYKTLKERLGDRRDLPFPSVKGIVFDLVDTLAVVDRDAYEDVKKEISSALGVDHALFKEAWANSRWLASTDWHLTPRKRIEMVAEELQCKLSPEDAIELGKKEEELWAKSIGVEKPTEDALEALQERGIKMVLVTNGSSAMRKLPVRLGLSKYLEEGGSGSFLSCEVKKLKPDEEIYERALAHLELEPEECLYVGDGSDRELEGAKVVGLFAVRMTAHRRQRPLYSSRDSLDWDATVGSMDALLKRMVLPKSRKPNDD